MPGRTITTQCCLSAQILRLQSIITKLKFLPAILRRTTTWLFCCRRGVTCKEQKHIIERRYGYALPILQPTITLDCCCRRKETKKRPNITSQSRGVDTGNYAYLRGDCVCPVQAMSAFWYWAQRQCNDRQVRTVAFTRPFF